MFNQVTEYKGKEDGFHLLRLKKLYETSHNSPNFYFIFDDLNNFNRARFEQPGVGTYDFKVLLPLRKRNFVFSDWYPEDCTKIKETIIREGSMFVSFSWKLIQHLIGSEQDIKTYLGYE